MLQSVSLHQVFGRGAGTVRVRGRQPSLDHEPGAAERPQGAHQGQDGEARELQERPALLDWCPLRQVHRRVDVAAQLRKVFKLQEMA